MRRPLAISPPSGIGVHRRGNGPHGTILGVFGGVRESYVLSGVYDLHILQDAQARGLTLFWAHDLDQLTGWIAST